MSYPMVNKKTKERWEKFIENTTGLPIDLIRRLDTTHMSFYIENKNKMTIKESNDEIFFFVWDNRLKNEIHQKVYGTELPEINREFVFDSQSLDKYLQTINFRGPKNDGNRFNGFMYSEY